MTNLEHRAILDFFATSSAHSGWEALSPLTLKLKEALFQRLTAQLASGSGTIGNGLQGFHRQAHVFTPRSEGIAAMDSLASMALGALYSVDSTLSQTPGTDTMPQFESAIFGYHQQVGLRQIYPAGFDEIQTIARQRAEAGLITTFPPGTSKGKSYPQQASEILTMGPCRSVVAVVKTHGRRGLWIHASHGSLPRISFRAAQHDRLQRIRPTLYRPQIRLHAQEVTKDLRSVFSLYLTKEEYLTGSSTVVLTDYRTIQSQCRHQEQCSQTLPRSKMERQRERQFQQQDWLKGSDFQVTDRGFEFGPVSICWIAAVCVFSGRVESGIAD